MPKSRLGGIGTRPITVTATEQIQLELPNWLPQPIATHAQQIFCRNNVREMSDQSLLCRLTTDSRMKRVWTELLKVSRKRLMLSLLHDVSCCL